MSREEPHSLQNTGWLRASVLRANDGIASTASVITGVAASHASLLPVPWMGVSTLSSNVLG